MSTKVTSGIKIIVETFFQPGQSNYAQSLYTFAYRITIENSGTEAVQLKRRHWYITDSIGPKSEVEGEGVIGEQPVIEPGKSYKYVSGCSLNSEMGKMHGSYLMERQSDGKLFEVKIPEFNMIVPYKLN